MSEDDLSSGPATASSASNAAPSAFGARLAWERERAGWSLNDMAARLRLHPKRVRALEEEQLAALPETAYVRGFVRSYARVLGIDPEPLLADLNAKLAPPSGSVVDGMRRPGDYSPVRAAAHEQVSRRLVIGLAVLGLIALGVIGWYANQQRAQAPVAAGIAPAQPAPAVETRTAPAPPAAAESPSADATAPIADAAPGADTSDRAEDVMPAPPPLLALRFNGTSWVEVTDSRGRVVLSQLNKAGDELLIDDSPPLAVVIGDASKASVEVRGETFALDSVTRSNVARFTVK